jgi:transcription initiation factor TFIIH subunit 4
LLKDTRSQLWTILQHYLKVVDADGGDVRAVLTAVLRLGFARTGDPLPLPEDKVEAETVRNLAYLGVVVPAQAGDFSTHYATPLARHLSADRDVPPAYGTSNLAGSGFDHSGESGGGGGESDDDADPGWIIVESNFKLYAYTSSPLHLQLLRRFCTLCHVLPNFVTALITRTSIKRALLEGISADQIIHFLVANVHRESKRAEHLPHTVTDQIRLWEEERRRVKHTEACHYSKFSTHEEVRQLADEARRIGALLWCSGPNCDPSTAAVVCRFERHDEIKQFIARSRAAAADAEARKHAQKNYF